MLPVSSQYSSAVWPVRSSEEMTRSNLPPESNNRGSRSFFSSNSFVPSSVYEHTENHPPSPLFKVPAVPSYLQTISRPCQFTSSIVSRSATTQPTIQSGTRNATSIVTNPHVTKNYGIAELLDILCGNVPVPEDGMFVEGGPVVMKSRGRDTQTRSSSFSRTGPGPLPPLRRNKSASTVQSSSISRSTLNSTISTQYDAHSSFSINMAPSRGSPLSDIGNNQDWRFAAGQTEPRSKQKRRVLFMDSHESESEVPEGFVEPSNVGGRDFLPDFEAQSSFSIRMPENECHSNFDPIAGISNSWRPESASAKRCIDSLFEDSPDLFSGIIPDPLPSAPRPPKRTYFGDLDLESQCMEPLF